MRRSILLTVLAALTAIGTACQPSTTTNTKPAVTAPTSTPVVIASPGATSSPSVTASPTASPAKDEKKTDDKKTVDKKPDIKASPTAPTAVKTPEKK